ncbi:hypothetical protein Rs2_44798 [Raphanus sativus]|nr:hypothetical protein Rs2_44798 [Raphanus sativus]
MRAYEAGHLLAGDGVNAEETHAPPFVISHGRQDLHVLDEGELRQIFSKSSDPYHLTHPQEATMTMELTTLVPTPFLLLRWKVLRWCPYFAPAETSQYCRCKYV